jgi:hypothetical protein
MVLYETVKVFDLSSAPIDLREADDFAGLRPNAANDDSAILSLQVGNFTSPQSGPVGDCTTREVTLTEYRLHRWLAEQGAAQGENILLRWKNDGNW